LFKPKDIVSGDFYWATEISTTKEGEDNEKLVVFSVADCTGHGVPGAFMSLIGLKIFNQSIKEPTVNSPAEALNFLNTEVYNTVNRHSDEEHIIRDGMDVALCAINYNTLQLTFAGANNPVYIIRECHSDPVEESINSKVTIFRQAQDDTKCLIEIKGDKQPIGSYEAQDPFSDKVYQLEKGDLVYIFSDGYADQFGGEKGKKLKYKPFKEMLIANANKPMEEQHQLLNDFFENWKGKSEQLDDVCVIGVKI